MSHGVFFGVGAGVLGLLLLMTLSSWIRKLQKKTVEAVEETLRGEKIFGMSSNANYFGCESLGMAQIRGNGVLAMTEKRIYFRMWKPVREVSIDLGSIIAVETPRSHLGKTKGRALLKVVFETENGRDSCAWLVRDLKGWREAVEKIIEKPPG